jgi:hypothetical protein
MNPARFLERRNPVYLSRAFESWTARLFLSFKGSKSEAQEPENHQREKRDPLQCLVGLRRRFARYLPLLFSLFLPRLATGEELRLGMIGLDTSHVIAFADLLHDTAHKNHVPGGRVVAAFKGGSPDIEASHTRVDRFTRELQEKHRVKIYD